MNGDEVPSSGPSRSPPVHDSNEPKVGTNPDNVGTNPDDVGTNADDVGTNDDAVAPNDAVGTTGDETARSRSTDSERVENKIRSPTDVGVATGQRDIDDDVAPSSSVATVGKKTGQTDDEEVGGQIWTSVGISVVAGERGNKAREANEASF